MRKLRLLRALFNYYRSRRLDQLATDLGILHGFPQKVGQHLTLYSFDNANKLSSLYNQGRTEDIDLEKELPQEVGFLSAVVAAQASIGQVYKVQSRLGELAVKIKYRRIQDDVSSDFTVVNNICKVIGILPVPIKPLQAFIHNLHKQIVLEFDYKAEAKIQEFLRYEFKNEKTIYIPQVFAALSSNTMLITEWINGEPLNDFLERATTADKDEVFRLLFKFQLTSLLEFNICHADPHPGNFLVQRTSAGLRIVVLDFGCIVQIDPTEQKVLKRLLLCDYISTNELRDDLHSLGFSNETLVTYERILGDIVSVLLEPFYSETAYNFDDWRLQYKLNTILAYKQWDIPFFFPPRIAYLIRMFHGLYHYAERYEIQFDWHRGLRDLYDQREGA